jgi:hypothetical protein
MANDYLLQEDGSSRLTLEDGSGFLLLESSTIEVEGGVSGGRVKKKIGRSLVEDQLGERPIRRVLESSVAQIVFTESAVSKGKILVPQEIHNRCIINPVYIFGQNIGSLIVPVKNLSESRLFTQVRSESIGIMDLTSTLVLRHLHKFETRLKRMKRLMMLQSIMNSFEDAKLSTIRQFEFSETVQDEALKAFTHSSSFVGNVRYDTEEQSMRILLNGKAYHFCNVPERIYDAFEGSNSKGAFFARSIKGQFDC